MHPGPHYYVISLSRHSNALFEAFRDVLIDIRNGGFPVVSDDPSGAPGAGPSSPAELRDTLVAVDRCFGAYLEQEPLRLVVVGDDEMLSLFSSLTGYSEAVLGQVEGDYSITSPRDLGKIVWPVVRESMSGVVEGVLRDLWVARRQGLSVAGVEAIAPVASSTPGATLLVERDYHVRGSLLDLGATLQVSMDVGVAEAMDDVVDVIIDRVVAAGGRAVFVPDGALGPAERMVLIPAHGASAQPSEPTQGR